MRQKWPVSERFWAKVDRRGECWLWLGVTNGSGYGQLYSGVGGRRGKMVYAHRLSWELAFGPVPPGLIVMHRCDNPRCVRPEHLQTGTFADNARDMAAKGRARPSNLKGEDHGNAMLTEVQVREIRRRKLSGERASALAEEFHVHVGHLYKVIRGTAWGHVY